MFFELATAGLLETTNLRAARFVYYGNLCGHPARLAVAQLAVSNFWNTRPFDLELVVGAGDRQRQRQRPRPLAKCRTRGAECWLGRQNVIHLMHTLDEGPVKRQWHRLGVDPKVAPNRWRSRAIMISATASVAVVIRCAFPSFIHLDGVSVALIVLALMPWMRSIIRVVELPGIGKIELREIEPIAQDAQVAHRSRET